MKGLFFSLALCVLTGCATSGTNSNDPYEDFNRSVYKFNRGLDKAVLQPVAKGYQAVTPDPVETGFSNFFDNIGDVGNMVNNALQFKLGDAASDLGRFLINSTIGLAGFFDPASAMGLEKSDEDFGQTLATWGVGSGPYLMLPFLGPSTMRDTFAMPGDNYLDPFSEVKPERDEYALKGFRLLITRAELLELESQLESAIDEYAFVRDAYLQNRKFKVYDGDLPLDDVFECDPEYEEC
ncbi:MAG: VacJ family lipoprotein [Gammaproteobacteria bacterium]|nr:VacJ family lipoprotein [Gammaproteobacteria bacterium]